MTPKVLNLTQQRDINERKEAEVNLRDSEAVNNIIKDYFRSLITY